MERRRLLLTIFLLAASCASAFARDGSVRAVVDSQGGVVESNDYYTYGKRHTTGRTYADLKNSPLLFSGKEDQGQALDLASGATTPSDLRILDFGARHYDPIVPRWTTPDPLAEKYFPINTYAYCAGDPVNLADPEGMDTVPKVPEDRIGTPEYYLYREMLFHSRTGKENDYYAKYGYKYATRFKELKEPGKLSKQGEIWVDEVMKFLKTKIEEKLEELGDDASSFEEEDNENCFSPLYVFAFRTHPEAYINANGKAPFATLEFNDYLQILKTIDIRDLVSKEGREQFMKVAIEYVPTLLVQATTPIPLLSTAFLIVNLKLHGKF